VPRRRCARGGASSSRSLPLAARVLRIESSCRCRAARIQKRLYWRQVMLNRVLLAAAAAALVILVGCASKPSSVKEATREIDDIRARSTETPIIQQRPDFYVDAEPLPAEEREPWLKMPVTFNANGLPFNAVVERVLRETAPSVNASFALDMEATRPVTFTYSGRVKGLFDQLARLTGFRYELNGPKVVWTEFVTRTFDVMLTPGGENFRIGRDDQNTTSQ